ncbi:unnamed protein product [Calypogeia fissa]
MSLGLGDQQGLQFPTTEFENSSLCKSPSPGAIQSATLFGSISSILRENPKALNKCLKGRLAWRFGLMHLDISVGERLPSTSNFEFWAASTGIDGLSLDGDRRGTKEERQHRRTVDGRTLRLCTRHEHCKRAS